MNQTTAKSGAILLDILAGVKISEVFVALGGSVPRHGRSRAFYRNGDGLSVSLSDAKISWFDHAEGTGGGVLDLIIRVRGGTRQDALKWLADLTGWQLDDRPVDQIVANEWRAFNADLPDARLWRRAMLSLLDDALNTLKSALFDPLQPRPDQDEILRLERLNSYLRGADERGLVAEFRVWRSKWPATTKAMIHAAHARERADREALWKFVCRMAS